MTSLWLKLSFSLLFVLEDSESNWKIICKNLGIWFDVCQTCITTRLRLHVLSMYCMCLWKLKFAACGNIFDSNKKLNVFSTKSQIMYGLLNFYHNRTEITCAQDVYKLHVLMKIEGSLKNVVMQKPCFVIEWYHFWSTFFLIDIFWQLQFWNHLIF